MLFANRDNYGFVTFRYADEAYNAIESKLSATLFYSKYTVSNGHMLLLCRCIYQFVRT